MHLISTLCKLVTGKISGAEAGTFVVLLLAFGLTSAMSFAALAVLLTEGSIAAAIVCGVVGLIAAASTLAAIIFRTK